MRKLITNNGYTDRVMRDIRDALELRLEVKGYHTFVSSHEISGVIDEEFVEMKESIRKNNNYDLRKELVDITVAAIWGIVSIDAGEMDW